jgi:hypothetical protein
VEKPDCFVATLLAMTSRERLTLLAMTRREMLTLLAMTRRETLTLLAMTKETFYMIQIIRYFFEG